MVPQDEAGEELRPFVGADGVAMLALSGLVLLVTGGATLLAVFFCVLRIALATPANASGATRILVLGYRLAADGQPARPFRERLERAAALFAASPQAVLFVLGGRTRPGLPSEAEAGAACLRAGGVPAERLRREDRSRHTLENLRHYRAAFPAGPEERVLLVTSRFHLARAGAMARGLSLNCTPCAAEASAASVLRRPGRLLMEAFLLHWYAVGNCFSRWTGNQRLLARIS